MSQFIKLNRDNFRNSSVRLYPERSYVSGSSNVGITGSVHLFSHTSSVEYVQVLDDNKSQYPSGIFWGNPNDTEHGFLANYMSGNMDAADGTKHGYHGKEQNSSINTIKNIITTGKPYFKPKKNPEFFITRYSPLEKVEDEALLVDGDVFTYVSDDNVRYWKIDASDKYDTANGFLEVDETEFSDVRWFDKIDITDLISANSLSPMDDGEYKNMGVSGKDHFVNQLLHKIDSSRVQKDIGSINNIKDVLMPYYKVSCPTMDYSYTNYHCINFFSSSAVQDNSAIIYRSPHAS